MRRLAACVVFALITLACGSKDPVAPDTGGDGDGDGDGDTDTDTGTDTSNDETDEPMDMGSGETDEPVECELLDEDQCNSAPECTPILGMPVAEDLSCREGLRFAFCSSTGDCDDAETGYLDPEGGCWWFHADCIFDYGGWESRPDECPDYDEFYELPECR